MVKVNTHSWPFNDRVKRAALGHIYHGGIRRLLLNIEMQVPEILVIAAQSNITALTGLHITHQAYQAQIISTALTL